MSVDVLVEGLVPARPLALPGLLDAGDLDGIEERCAFSRHPAPASYTSFDERTEFAAVPADLGYVVEMLAIAGGNAFDLPVGGVHAVVLRYAAGVGHDWHADGSDLYEQGRDRTVSFSLLLNEPGRDFAGGDFETEFGPVSLGAGDAVVFTAATLHRVTPVTRGRRLVLVCFASATDRRGP